MAYSNWRPYRYSHENRPNHQHKWGHYEDSYQPSYLDDYTTSAMSYEESIKRPRLISPHSRSEHSFGRQRRGRRERYDYKSPTRDYISSIKDDLLKRRSEKTKNDIQKVFYQLGFERDNLKKSDRWSRSPGRSYEFEDSLIYDSDDKYYGYDKYFEKSKTKEKTFKNHINEEISEDKKKNDQRKSYSKKENDYHVFSYREPKMHDKVFRNKEKYREKSPPSSEIEIKTTDYPVLAFKGITLSEETSKTTNDGVLFLPTVYCKDTSHKHQGKTKHRTKLNPQKDTQVYAANVKVKKDIFIQEEHSKIKQSSTSKATETELQTEESLMSRDTKQKGDSNARVSTETQTEESLIFEKSPVTSGYKNAGAIIGSILERSAFREAGKTKRYEPSSPMKNNNLLAYQIDIDIEPTKKNVFGSKDSNKLNPTEIRPLEYKQIKGHPTKLKDNYPVMKDYIKVSDNSSMDFKTSMFSNSTRLFRASTENPAGRTSNIKYVVNYDHSDSKKDKQGQSRNPMSNAKFCSALRKSELVIKELPESSLTRAKNYDMDDTNHRVSTFQTQSSNNYSKNVFQPHNTQIFRSMENNTPAFEKSMAKTPSVVNIIENQLAKSLPPEESDFGQKISKGGERVNSMQKGKMSMNNQKDPFTVGETGQSFIRKSRVEKINIDSPSNGQNKPSVVTADRQSRTGDSLPVGRKSQTAIRKSRVDSQFNTESPQLDRKSQAVVRESKVDEPTTNKSPLSEDRKKQSIRESRAAELNADSSPGDRKSQLIRKETKLNRHSDSSLVDQQKQESRSENSKTRESRYESPNHTVDKNENVMDNQNKPLQRTSYTPKHDESKSILKTSTLPRKKSKAYSKADQADSEKQSVVDNAKPKEERKSSNINSNEHIKTKSQVKNQKSHSKLSGLFNQNKIRLESEEEVEAHKRKSSPEIEALKRKSSPEESYPSRKSSAVRELEKIMLEDEESKPKTKSLNKSKIKDTTSKKSFSRLFSKTKSKSEKENEVKSKQSKHKLQSAEERHTAVKDDSSTPLSKTPSHTSRSQSRKLTKTQSSSSKSQDKSKTKSMLKSFLSPAKSKTNKGSSSTVNKDPETRTHESTRRPHESTQGKASNEQEEMKQDVKEGEKPCECIVQYVKQARECGTFFLGTSLHEQIMDILKVV